MTKALSLASLALLLAAPPALAGVRVPPVASYRIEATYDRDHRLSGKETVTFVNRTSRPFADVQLHLYLNGFRNTRSTWMREAAEGSGRGRGRKAGRDESRFGYSELKRVVLADGTDLTSKVRYIAPDDGNADDRTVVSIPLPRPVGPGETLVFDLEFRAKFPRAIARTGWKDDYLLAAQWFPKLGVATDAGWVTHQFHAGTEFFADFGDYDVTLTLPSELKGKVGATGVARETSDLAGGLTRVRFTAEDVHDFAWTASPRFEVYRDTFSRPGLPSVDLILFLQPDHRAVKERYFHAAKAGLESYGRWFLPYPYAALTIVDPPYQSNTSGMEYPTLFTGGSPWLAPKGVHAPEGVTIHEFGHQVFYGMLASNEVDEAHLDEGFNTYATFRTLKKTYGDPYFVKRIFDVPFVFKSIRAPLPMAQAERALDWQVASRSDPTTAPTFRNLDGGAIRVNAYSKTALVLASLERTLGEEVWDPLMKTYAQRYAFKHPTTSDFRSVAREVAGPRVNELLDQTWGSTSTIDYAVTVAASKKAEPAAGYVGEMGELKFAAKAEGKGPSGYESVVVVRRLGEASWPMDVELRFAGGVKVRRAWDGKDRWVKYRITGPKLLSAVVDPDQKCLLDVNVLNNGLAVEPNATASRRWGHRLRFWSQNLLELFALLGAAVR